MNRNFKVVFSKARGALMVVNEATSSIQAKGTKTVIAAAIAAVAGTAMAASAYVEAPTEAGDNVALFTATFGTNTTDKLLAQNSYVTDKSGAAGDAFLAIKDDEYKLTADHTLWVTGTGANGQATGIWLKDKGTKATNESTIYVTTGKDGKPWQNRAMGASTGEIVNNGTIVAKDAYGMTVGSSSNNTVTITNGINGKIIVEDRGVGIELGGLSGQNQTTATATNYGTITVSAAKDFKDANYRFATGVAIQGDSKNSLTAQQTFTNKGTIDAVDDGYAKAIELKYVQGAKVNNDGIINGVISVGTGATGTTISLNEASVLNGDISVEGDGTTIKLDDAAVTTGDIIVNSTATGDNVQGTTIAATAETGKVSTLTGSILAQQGSVQQTGSLKAESVVVGTLAAGTTAATSGTYTVDTGAKLAVESATVNTGTLNVAGELTTGELTTVKTVKSENETVSGAASVTGTLSAGKITNAGTLTLGTSGTVKVTGTGSVNKGSIAKAENASDDTFEVTKGADFTNEADAVMGADKQHLSTIKVAEGATLKNSGLIYVNTLTVDGTVDTGMFVPKSTTDKTLVNHLKFETLTLNDGAKFNMSAYPEVTGAEKTSTAASSM